jgi:hypothetical protein
MRNPGIDRQTRSKTTLLSPDSVLGCLVDDSAASFSPGPSFTGSRPPWRRPGQTHFSGGPLAARVRCDTTCLPTAPRAHALRTSRSSRTLSSNRSVRNREFPMYIAGKQEFPPYPPEIGVFQTRPGTATTSSCPRSTRRGAWAIGRPRRRDTRIPARAAIGSSGGRTPRSGETASAGPGSSPAASCMTTNRSGSGTAPSRQPPR